MRRQLAEFDYEAEYTWIDQELRHNDQLFDIARLGRTAEQSAFVALMDDDPRAEAMAIRAVREIMKFDRWDFFLDGDTPISVQRASQMTVTVSLVVDFIGDRIAPGECREWLETMQTRGCEACFRTIEDIRHPRSVIGWRFDPESTFFEHRPGNRTDMNRRPEITINTNLRAVPASALAIGAVALERAFGSSADTSRYREMGVWGMEIFRDLFKSDGSYDEENNYAHYTALHLTQAIIALRRRGGPDLSDLIDWDAYTDYLFNTVMPTTANPYGVVNWGDTGNTPESVPMIKRTSLPVWIAAENGNAFAQGFALERGGQHDIWSALWFDPTVKPKMPPNRPHLWVSELDRVVARTGYEAEHLVVAMRSGPPANHEHADRNSLIVKCFGEELITDPLRPVYDYSDPAWKMRLTEGHSAVLIDGNGHQHHNGIEGTNASNAFARIVSHESNDRFASWISDASQPYRLVDTDVKKVVRSVGVLFDQPAIIVVDHITKWSRSSRVSARYFGYNWDQQLALRTTGSGFEIRRPGATLAGQVFSPSKFSIRQGTPTVPAEIARRHPYIDVEAAPSRDLTLITVMAVAASDSPLPQVQSDQQGTRFTFSIGGEVVRVDDGVISLA
ncbi:MAG: hypothetical protein SynsKO_44320 [Synoicihabitans sp.]